MLGNSNSMCLLSFAQFLLAEEKDGDEKEEAVDGVGVVPGGLSTAAQRREADLVRGRARQIEDKESIFTSGILYILNQRFFFEYI